MKDNGAEMIVDGVKVQIVSLDTHDDYTPPRLQEVLEQVHAACADDSEVESFALSVFRRRGFLGLGTSITELELSKSPGPRRRILNVFLGGGQDGTAVLECIRQHHQVKLIRERHLEWGWLGYELQGESCQFALLIETILHEGLGVRDRERIGATFYLRDGRVVSLGLHDDRQPID